MHVESSMSFEPTSWLDLHDGNSVDKGMAIAASVNSIEHVCASQLVQQ
jgi:hypothetical protein